MFDLSKPLDVRATNELPTDKGALGSIFVKNEIGTETLISALCLIKASAFRHDMRQRYGVR